MSLPRLLFVDDEPALLGALQNQLRKDRHRWDVAFAGNGRDALEVMAKAPADIVISDMRMPGMDGAELLRVIKRDFPGTTRVVLSGYAETEAIMRALSVTHQYLQKPCNIETLRALIERTLHLRQTLDSEPLAKLVGAIDRLPVVPAIHHELVALSADPRASIAKFANVVESDPAVSAKVLQLVNSAYFGLPQRVVSLQQAVRLLGMEVIKGLILLSDVFDSHVTRRVAGFSLEEMQRTAMLTASLSKWLVCDGTLGDTAYTAGLLHDIGRVILLLANADLLGETHAYAQTHGCDATTAEEALFGVSHAETGAYLLGLWGVPFAVVEAVAFHHRPAVIPSGERRVIAAVHLASELVHAACNSNEPRIDMDFVRAAELPRTLDEARAKAASLLDDATDEDARAG